MSYVYKETKGADGGPLLFTFHGTGGDESQFHGLGEQILPDAHVVSPRGDVEEGPGPSSRRGRRSQNASAHRLSR